MRNCIYILLFLTFTIKAQFIYTRFGAELDDSGNAMIQTMKRGYAVVGSTSSFGALQQDVYLALTDSLFQPIWEKNIGGSLADVGKSIVELADSSLVIAGFSNSYGPNGYDALIVRVNKNGNTIWSKTYGGTNWEFANSICKSSNGHLIIVGNTDSYGRGGKDAFVLEMDTTGVILSTKYYGGAGDDDFNEIIPTSDGGFIAVGTTKSYGDVLGDVWIAKLTVNGDSTWFITNGGNKKEVGRGVVQDKNGDYIVVGGSESYTNGGEDAYIVKLKNNNTFDWYRNYGMATENEEIFNVKNSTSSYAEMMVCYTTNEVSGFKKDAKALLLDGLGYYKDGGRVGDTEDEEVFCIANSNDKGYALVGYTKSFNSLQKDIFIIKFDSLVHGSGTLVLAIPAKDNIQSSNFQVYPNPFNESITITNNLNNEKISVQLINSTGQLIWKEDFMELKDFSLKTNEFKNGIYFLKVISNNQIRTYKLVCIN